MMKVCNFCGNKNFREKHVQYIYKHNDRFLVVNNVPLTQHKRLKPKPNRFVCAGDVSLSCRQKGHDYVGGYILIMFVADNEKGNKNHIDVK